MCHRLDMPSQQRGTERERSARPAQQMPAQERAQERAQEPQDPATRDEPAREEELELE